MTRRAALPSEARVRAALSRLQQQAADTGKRPTVLALAREFRLSDTTFRRQFPDIVRDIADSARSKTHPASSSTSRYDQLVARNAKQKRPSSAPLVELSRRRSRPSARSAAPPMASQAEVGRRALSGAPLLAQRYLCSSSPSFLGPSRSCCQLSL